MRGRGGASISLGRSRLCARRAAFRESALRTPPNSHQSPDPGQSENRATERGNEATSSTPFDALASHHRACHSHTIVGDPSSEMSVALHTQCCVEHDSQLRMKFSPYETDELFTPPHRCNKHPRKASELKSHTILWVSPNQLVCQHCVESLGHLTRWCEIEAPLNTSVQPQHLR